MEDRKWIFIEKSMDTVRYKVGNSSMEDSQEYVLCQDSSLPSTFEIIPTEKKEGLSTEDALEIYDDHFRCNSSSSCQTSDMEDSDIEVVLKSPSSSESASLCSRNSSLSLPINSDACKYDGMIFNVDIGTRISSANEEEDSEVEVIGRSIHCEKSLEVSHVEEIQENTSESAMLPLPVSEHQNENEIEDVVETLEAEETLCCADEYEVDPSKQGRKESYVEAVEDFGTKYLSEDLHVTRQTCNRMISLKTSTVLLIVCTSATLGVYLGNYFAGQSLDGDEEVVIPDNISNSNAEDPLSVNITFKYSASTKETLKGVLLSFRKLKQDYDRLYAAYHDLKEKSHLKRQMTVYWKKQVGKLVEAGDHIDTSTRGKVGTNYSANITQGDTKTTLHNSTSHFHRIEIQKLSSDLTRQRKNVMYWKTMYKKVLLSKENTCPKDAPASPYFSFANCFNIFTKVIPKLDITALNITKPVADQVHNAWNKLRNRWNNEDNTKKDDHTRAMKLDRFRKIFVIGNIVNSVDRNHDDISNDSQVEVDACDNELYPYHDFSLGKQEESFSSTSNENQREDGDIPVYSTYTSEGNNNSSTNTSKPAPRNDGTERAANVHELRWSPIKFKKSKFLVDFLKWQTNYRKRMNKAKRIQNEYIANEKGLRSKLQKQLNNLKIVNQKVREEMYNNSIYYDNIRRRVKQLKVLDNRKCNLSKLVMRRTLKKRYSSLINEVKHKVRIEERKKTSKKVYYLMNRVKRRYNSLITEAVKVVRREEKAKFVRKLNNVRKLYKLGIDSEQKMINLPYKEKKGKHVDLTKRYHTTNENKRTTERLKSSDMRKTSPRFKKKIHKSKKPFRRNNGKEYNRCTMKDKEEDNDRRHENKIRRLENEYQQSILEVTELREMYNNAIEEAHREKQLAKEYKEELEKHKAIVKEYEGRMNKLVGSEDAATHALVMDTYEEVAPENEGVATKTQIESESVFLHADVDIKRDVDEGITEDSIKVRKDLIDGVPTGNCNNEVNGNAFYNINDVYPEDLFSRTVSPIPSVPTTTFSQPEPITFLPQKDLWHIPHSTFVDFSAFHDNAILFSGTNKSNDFTEGVSQVNVNEEFPMSTNWYVKWMGKKRKGDSDSESFDVDDADNGGFWFWKMMKERDKVRFADEELNWFWNAMKEREKLRTYSSEEELNWFLAAMREREKLRYEDEDGN